MREERKASPAKTHGGQLTQLHLGSLETKDVTLQCPNQGQGSRTIYTAARLSHWSGAAPRGDVNSQALLALKLLPPDKPTPAAQGHPPTKRGAGSWDQGTDAHKGL